MKYEIFAYSVVKYMMVFKNNESYEAHISGENLIYIHIKILFD